MKVSYESFGRNHTVISVISSTGQNMLKPHAQKLLILNKNVRFDSKYT